MGEERRGEVRRGKERRCEERRGEERRGVAVVVVPRAGGDVAQIVDDT